MTSLKPYKEHKIV
jgi:hypothetical protein